MGQVTENVVARNIYITNLSTQGLGNSLIADGSSSAGSLYASNQAAAALQNQGLKYEYYWGMYSESSFFAGETGS